MTMKFTIEKLNEHPMAIYAKESVEARDQVVTETRRLVRLASDESVTEKERNDAQSDLDELTSVLGQMDEVDRAFLARVVVASFPPKDEVVQRTIELNAALAGVVVDANRARTFINLVTQWVNGVSAVVTGNAGTMP